MSSVEFEKKEKAASDLSTRTAACIRAKPPKHGSFLNIYLVTVVLNCPASMGSVYNPVPLEKEIVENTYRGWSSLTVSCVLPSSEMLILSRVKIFEEY
jgi:hypothetical protein